MSEVSLAEMRTTLAREFEHVAGAKGVGFAIDLAPGSPESVVTDPQRLRQILTNLLSNAFKFTERGEVRLEVGIADDGWSATTDSLCDAPAVLAFAVSDTGLGIDPAEHHRIFEAFAQTDGTSARSYGGTGLGLSISRELVGLLGGEITLTSAPGEGSIFTVYIPAGAFVAEPSPAISRQAAQPARRPVVPDALGDHDFHGTKVLVVDDDFRNIFAMTALLERCHADVTVAESGSAALAILARDPDIEIVLMDIMMPLMDGYATIRSIRALEHFERLPIIALTGKVMPGERQRCIDAGANDFVPKPVDTRELYAALRPWLPATSSSSE
jgi:CheY-like chemotaxis protein/two-component sensor histidine kinase